MLARPQRFAVVVPLFAATSMLDQSEANLQCPQWAES